MAKITNIHAQDWTDRAGPGHFKAKTKWLTRETDLCNLACSMFQLDEDMRAFPAHAHYGNDEAILVLKGNATITIGEESHELKEGDYLTLPKGTGRAHQMIDGAGGVTYLCISTNNDPDVVTYPNSEKVGAFAGWNFEEVGAEVMLLTKNKGIGYYDDEPGADE